MDAAVGLDLGMTVFPPSSEILVPPWEKLLTKATDFWWSDNNI